MKLSEIKTKQGFYDFADIWYQREHNLRRIWQSDDFDMVRKQKAFILWLEEVLFHSMKNGSHAEKLKK